MTDWPDASSLAGAPRDPPRRAFFAPGLCSVINCCTKKGRGWCQGARHHCTQIVEHAGEPLPSLRDVCDLRQSRGPRRDSRSSGPDSGCYKQGALLQPLHSIFRLRAHCKDHRLRCSLELDWQVLRFTVKTQVGKTPIGWEDSNWMAYHGPNPASAGGTVLHSPRPNTSRHRCTECRALHGRSKFLPRS